MCGKKYRIHCRTREAKNQLIEESFVQLAGFEHVFLVNCADKL